MSALYRRTAALQKYPASREYDNVSRSLLQNKNNGVNTCDYLVCLHIVYLQTGCLHTICLHVDRVHTYTLFTHGLYTYHLFTTLFMYIYVCIHSNSLFTNSGYGVSEIPAVVSHIR